MNNDSRNLKDITKTEELEQRVG